MRFWLRRSARRGPSHYRKVEKNGRMTAECMMIEGRNDSKMIAEGDFKGRQGPLLRGIDGRYSPCIVRYYHVIPIAFNSSCLVI
jgi:hypothetical protein